MGQRSRMGDPHMPTFAGDPYDLQRFLAAQESNLQTALSELRAGRKRTHWSWYIFPQLLGLGASAMSMRYAIGSLAEARAYLAHPVLGARLRDCVEMMTTHAGLSAIQILGEVDARKFRSCLTLFAQASHSGALFVDALDIFFSGRPDEATLAFLANAGAEGDPGGYQ